MLRCGNPQSFIDVNSCEFSVRASPNSYLEKKTKCFCESLPRPACFLKEFISKAKVKRYACCLLLNFILQLKIKRTEFISVLFYYKKLNFRYFLNYSKKNMSTKKPLAYFLMASTGLSLVICLNGINASIGKTTKVIKHISIYVIGVAIKNDIPVVK